MLDAVAMGELLIDFTCLQNDDSGYPTMAANPGGAPANFLAALAEFGGKTAFIGKVGSDAFGRLLKKTLEERGIGTEGLVLDDRVFTSLAFVTLDGDGNREFSFARKPGADTCLTAEEIPFALIDRASVFHFGSLSLTGEPARSATVAAVEYARSRGKLLSFDPNLREPLWPEPEEARRQMLWGISQADILKISDNEVEFLFGLEPAAAAAHILDTYDTELVYVTCGHRGCYYSNRSHSGFVPAIKGIKVTDTTGAGDIFGGSAMWKLLRLGKAPRDLSREELEAIVRFACVSAGLSTTRHGGIASVPALQTVLDFHTGEG